MFIESSTPGARAATYRLSLASRILTLLTLALGCATSQTPYLSSRSPSQVINLVDSLKRDTGQIQVPTASSRFKVKGVTAAGGTWAVLMPYSSDAAAVVVGDGASTRSFLARGAFARITLGQDQRIHLLTRAKPGENVRTVNILDVYGKDVGSYTLPTRSAIPFRGPAGISWRGPAGFFHGDSGARISFHHTNPAPDASIGQRVFAGTSKAGSDFTFGDMSELITLYAPDGSVLHSYPAPLDDAYRLIGASVPKMPISSEQGRVIWATSSSDGLLYVCLSGLSVSGPDYIAVFEPDRGRLLQVIGLDLPSLSTRVSSINPLGHIVSGMGAVGDKLVIVDQMDALMAVY